jgi:excisionase family DNA binding protein
MACTEVFEMNLLNDVKTTCRLLSMSRTHLYEEIKRGRITPVKSGSKTLFHRAELERYAASLTGRGCMSLNQTVAS